MIGIRTSATSDCTMPPKAAPMTTPTARSTTFPRSANFLNSSSIIASRACRNPSDSHHRTEIVETLVDQARVNHGGADRRPRRLGHPDHGQPHGLIAFSENRQRVFPPRTIG